MQTLIINIKQLVQVRETNVETVSGADISNLPILENAYLLIENDLISSFGLMKDLSEIEVENVIDATGKVVMPTWVDSHTHIVYAGNRVQEFVDRINGLSYEEIANRGGGILNSAQLLNETSEESFTINPKHVWKRSFRREPERLKSNRAMDLHLKVSLKCFV